MTFDYWAVTRSNRQYYIIGDYNCFLDASGTDQWWYFDRWATFRLMPRLVLISLNICGDINASVFCLEH